MSTPRPLLVAVYALLCLIWGTTWSVIVVALRDIPPSAGLALRFFLAGVLLWSIARARGVVLGQRPRERLLWVVNGILSFCVAYGVVYWAEQWVPSGLTAVLWATYPLFVALLAHLFLPDERLGWTDGLGTLVGFAGVALLYAADFDRLGGDQVRYASIVLLASPLASAIASVTIKRFGGGIHPLSLTAPPMVLTGLVMGTLAAATEDLGSIRLTRAALLSLLYLTIVGSAISFTLYFWLLARVQARRVSLIAFIVPLIAVTIGTLLGEPFTGEMIVGALLVVGGVALAVSGRRSG